MISTVYPGTPVGACGWVCPQRRPCRDRLPEANVLAMLPLKHTCVVTCSRRDMSRQPSTPRREPPNPAGGALLEAVWGPGS